jgi:hypothetical protein
MNSSGSSKGRNSSKGKGIGGLNKDISSVKGYSVILATCDTAREREANKELLNLLTQTIEIVYPELSKTSNASHENVEKCNEESMNSTNASDTKTVQDLLAEELADIRSKSKDKTKSSHTIVSLNTGVKGLILVKLIDGILCPIKLVTAIFDKIKSDKSALSR